MRDAKISEAIEAIGESSPEARRMILASEVTFDKKTLETMASATKEEIAGLAAQIEEGNYKKNKPDTPTAEPVTLVDAIISGMQPLDRAISKVASDVAKGLQEIRKKADRTKLQKALRAKINTLEDLYGSI